MTQPTPRPFNGAEDLARIMYVVGEWNAQTNFGGYLHPGDIAHFVSNGMRKDRRNENLQLVEDEAGQIIGVIMLYPPKYKSFAVMTHPQKRGAFEDSLIGWAEEQLLTEQWQRGIEADELLSDMADCDPQREALLTARGYVKNDAPWLICTLRSLEDSIPSPDLPEGFTMRSAEGFHEADALGEVHSSAFDSEWQQGEYLQVMRSPGFEVERELVMVAPDGHLAAFLIYWLDPVTKCGLFEPVGCHKDFRRRGLTRALMYEGMRRMVEHGMIKAMVCHEVAEENPASAGLYASVGFQPIYRVSDSRKTLKQTME
jgi:mycothiol synthase